MFCNKCGKQIQDNAATCNYCGGQVNQIANSPNPASFAGAGKNNAGKENYSSIFWKLFLFSFLLYIFDKTLAGYINNENISNSITLVISLAVISWFCISLDNAMKSIGKKYWWAMGLLALIPFGFWVVYFTARHQFKPLGKWGNDKVILITMIGVPVIGIIAGMVLVSMGPARSQARDARRQSDMKQMASAQSEWFAANGHYYTCGQNGGDCQGDPNNLPSSIGAYLNPVPTDPYTGKYDYRGLDNTADNGTDYCYYAQLENGGYYAASNNGLFKRSTPPDSMQDCQIGPGPGM